MQESHLMDFKLKCFSLDLQDLIFKKRTQEGLTDGCAIFFNSDLMELISEEKVEYFQPDVYVSCYTDFYLLKINKPLGTATKIRFSFALGAKPIKRSNCGQISTQKQSAQ